MTDGGTESDGFKYDVGFSFLAEDEATAVELNDLIAGRLTTFLYSQRQRELAGRDGEEAFNKAFSAECRSVVVLFRKGWGESPWTRIEETGIRNRAHEEGYDFCLFVGMEERPQLPRWVPRNRLYLGFQRYGAVGAAAVIEQRVLDLGGSTRVESVEQIAARTARNRDFQSRRESALRAGDLHIIVQQAAAAAGAALRHLVERFNSAQSSIRLECIPADASRFPIVTGLRGDLSFNHHMAFTNTLDRSQFKATIWHGPAPRPGTMFADQPKPRFVKNVGFDYSRANEYVWVMDDHQLSPPEFAKALFDWYVAQADQDRPS